MPHLTVRGYPLGEHSRGLLSCEGALTYGANRWALEPRSPRVGELICLVVSHRLHDPIEEVEDNTSCPLNRLEPWNLYIY